MIDLTVDEKAFYFNEYSGELSLVFPKAERTSRGGILAYVLVSSTISFCYLCTCDINFRDGNVVLYCYP